MQVLALKYDYSGELQLYRWITCGTLRSNISELQTLINQTEII